MATLAIVEALDPLGNSDLGGVSREEDRAVDQLGLQCAVKAFDNIVVPALTSAAHAHGDLRLLEGLEVGKSGGQDTKVRLGLFGDGKYT